MIGINNIITEMLRKNLFIKNKLFSIVIRYLHKNKDDAQYFLKETEKILKMPELKFIPDEKDKYQWIKDLKITTVIDIGAWKGDSVLFFHDLFPLAAIYSFEPLRSSYDNLALLKNSIPQLKTFNFALGIINGETAIYKNEHSPSSSILKMRKLHKDSFPFTTSESIEKIKIRTLDSVSDEIDFTGNTLLKIDVQGYEEKVLLGAINTLKQIKIIIIELSFEELYDGQPEFETINKLLISHGFFYSGSWHQLVSPRDGKILQQNSIYIKK